MVDTKKFKEVSATFSATAASVGSFPAAVAPGATQVLTVSTVGVQFVSFAAADGSTTLDIVDDDAAAPATPTGIVVAGIHRTTLPSYTDGDAAIPHFDSRGRLLVSQGETGITADVAIEDDAGPSNPVGTFPLGLHRTTLPTYTDGDAASFHFNASGRLLTLGVNSDTGATSTVAASASNVTLLAANTSRLGATIYNDSASATLHLKLGATASLTDYTTKVGPESFFEVPFGYTGIIDGIWDAATGDARITELT